MHKYVSTFYTYKEATRQVTEWIQSRALQALKSLRSSAPEAEASQQHDGLFSLLSAKAAHKRKPRISEFDDMLDTLNVHPDAPEFRDLPKVISACDLAIKLRAQSNEYHELAKDAADPAVRDANDRHRHFIAAMKRWREKLQHLAQRRPARSSTSQSLEQPFGEMAMGESHTSSDSSDDEAGELTGMVSSGVGEQCTQLTATTATDGALQLAELTLDDFDDIVFVLQCMLVDLDDLMRTVANEWLAVHDGRSNYVQASLATLLAFRRVVDLTQQMQQQFPEIASFEDFCCAVMQREMETESSGPDWVNAARIEQRLRKYAQNREYPERTLFPIMKGLAIYLRSFRSAIPKGKPATRLALRTGYFGEPYSEVYSQVTSFMDFGKRFLLEHLPVIYNDYLLMDGFKRGSLLQFELFNEVFEEFHLYFRESLGTHVSSIPFVFLVTAWYHSVQITQGGLYLSRVTAITRKALNSLVESMKTHEAEHRNPINAPFYDECAPKVKFLHQCSSLYRNHPFMAGVISLDVAVNIALFLGRATIPFSFVTHRALHLYNAMVHGGDMQPAPVMEKFLAVHSRAFFLPARPSRNFLTAVEKNCPGIEEKKASKLHRVLFEKSVDGIEHDSFLTLVKAVQSIWTDDFCERHLLGFNIMAFEQALIPIINEIGALEPSLLSQDDYMVFFIGLFDKRILLPIAHKARKIFSDGLQQLNMRSFDLLPRVPGSMQEAVFGALVSFDDDDSSMELSVLFGDVMDVFEDHSGDLSPEEFQDVFKTAREHPGILSQFDALADPPHHLMSGVLNHVAGGKRANLELLECLMQICPDTRVLPVTAAHAAAAAGNEQALDLLLCARNFADRDRQCKRAGNTPLHYAAMHGHLDTVKYLASNMVNPDVKNERGETALDVAKTGAVRDELKHYRNAHHDDMFRIMSRPASEARANERRWAEESEERSMRLHRKLNSRRAKKEVVTPITADEVEKAKNAELELLAMLDKEKGAKGEDAKNKHRKSGGKKGRKKKQ